MSKRKRQKRKRHKRVKKNTDLRSNLRLETYAVESRANPTESEVVMMNWLRHAGLMFYFQEPISPYIVDFWLPKLGMVIEVDGGYHKMRKRLDKRRTRSLLKSGVTRVVRITNEELLAREYPKRLHWFLPAPPPLPKAKPPTTIVPDIRREGKRVIVTNKLAPCTQSAV